jgi:hypothetical protein
LEKDVHALYKKHPDMLEANIIEHVVKYKILEKMVGSPKRHCAQLFHMMAMVDTCGLPPFFSHFLKMKNLNSSGVTAIETFSKILVKI